MMKKLYLAHEILYTYIHKVNIKFVLKPIPDFGISTAILNPVESFRRWFKLNFGP